MNADDFKKIQDVADLDLNNLKATLQKYPLESEIVNNLLKLYQSLSENLNTYPRDLTPILQMYWVCFRRFLVSTSLVLQGHLPETFALISEASEATASARKMSMNPEKIPGWIKRTKKEGQPFLRVLGKLFPQEDKLIYPEIFNIYELTSEHGRHPSFQTTIFFSDFSRMNTDDKVYFVYSEFEPEENLHRAINYAIFAFYKFLYVFKEVFKKYLKTAWIKEFELFEASFNAHKDSLREKFKVDESLRSN